MDSDFDLVICNMFRKVDHRLDQFHSFKPYFYRFIGGDNNDNYNNSLKLLKDKIEEHKEVCIFFEKAIPMESEFELIQYIYNELEHMDIGNIRQQEIVLFKNENINTKFLEALDYVVSLSIKKENFFNENIRNNFITKLIVWVYSHIRKINFNSDFNPKCIYYGNINRHEVYFLILLYLMGFDVLYINPLKEEFFEEIDLDNLSKCEKSMGILQLETFESRAAQGKIINSVETITKKIEKDVQNDLFSDTGIYKPWQFRDGYVHGILFDTVLSDIKIYWREPSRLREGFKVEKKLVTVPCFFYKIEGQYTNLLEYKYLVEYCKNSNNTLFFKNGNISKEEVINDEVYELMFCQLSDGTFDIEEVKKTSIYKFKKYSKDVQDIILKKVNEIILNNHIFNFNLDKEKILKLLVLVLSLNEDIVRLIDNFDFTGEIPKIIIYLEKEDEISDSMVMLLGYLHLMAFDILIFNPSGLFNINRIISKEAIINIRLNKMDYDSTYKSILATKESVISRILKNI